MRLLHTTDYTFCEFEDADLEPYAILSHRWGPTNEEVTYQQLLNTGYRSDSYGCRKIVQCCEIARSRGLDWAWIDTCCIDKTNSSELTESINSIYSWYRQSKECYVFLSDVLGHEQVDADNHAGLQVDSGELCSSCWFTRGWTLQELLAPHSMLFYDRDYSFIGDRLYLTHLISKASGID